MDAKLRNDADTLIKEVLLKIQITDILRKELKDYHYPQGKLYVVAIGKAAYEMAKVANDMLEIERGFVITKYGHSNRDLEQFEIFEAAHPLTDKNGIEASKYVVKELSCLKKEDEVLLLLSGGGSALFEIPVITLEELRHINDELLRSGASIDEINTIRKRLSRVKGGRFAKAIEPAKIKTLVISDVISNRLDVIASGPAYPDTSTCAEALAIIRKYQLSISEEALNKIEEETPKSLTNIDTKIISSVKELALAAKDQLMKMGYTPHIFTDQLEGDAEEVAEFLVQQFISEIDKDQPTFNALIATGETTVKVKGNGLGGRNQHLALCAAKYIKDKDIAIISIGSDGSDGPTDAAGGYADGDTYDEIKDYERYIKDNDAYHALGLAGGLLKTGPTGTNINDLIVIFKK